MVCYTCLHEGGLGATDRQVSGSGEADSETVHWRRLDDRLHGAQGEHDALHGPGGGGGPQAAQVQHHWQGDPSGDHGDRDHHVWLL